MRKIKVPRQELRRGAYARGGGVYLRDTTVNVSLVCKGLSSWSTLLQI